MSDDVDSDHDISIEDIVIKVCKINNFCPLEMTDEREYKRSLENIFQDVKPKRIVMGMISSNALNGDYQSGP